MTASSPTLPRKPLQVGGAVNVTADGMPAFRVEGDGRRLVVHLSGLRSLWSLRSHRGEVEGPLADFLGQTDLALEIRIEGRVVARKEPSQRLRPRWLNVLRAAVPGL